MDGFSPKYERLFALQAEVAEAYCDLGVMAESEPLPLASPVETIYQPTPEIVCHACDFRNLPVETGTVNAVITDIPYVMEWLPNVVDFAEWCRKVLKPGGVMVTFYGQHHLDKCMNELSKFLHYQWIFVSPLCGVNKNIGNPVSSRFQLAVVYSNSAKWKVHRVTEDWTPGHRIPDLIPNDRQRDSGDHPHRKNLSQMQFLVEAFSQEDDLVCDPCAGSFTTAEACWHTNRRFIGSDIDPKCLEMARKRFQALNI